jgi:hypothetical protein
MTKLVLFTLDNIQSVMWEVNQAPAFSFPLTHLPFAQCGFRWYKRVTDTGYALPHSSHWTL